MAGRRTLALRLLAAGLLVAAAVPAGEAQTRAAPRGRGAASPPSRGYVSLNAGAQVAREAFEPALTFPLYREQARAETAYDAPAGLVFDLGGGVRVWRRLAAGLAVTRVQTESAAALTASLPHPLFLSRNRELDERVPNLERVETAAHVQVSWVVSANRRVTLALFGGPTILRLEQDVVTALDLEETYPYDEVRLGAGRRTRREETAFGAHAGADVMYRIGRRIGIGAVARYTRATASVAVDDDERADATAGGLLLTGGLRWFF